MTRILPLGCLGAVLLLGAACVVSIDREGYIERDEQRFLVPEGEVVEVALYTFDGAVEIRSWDRPEVLIEIEKRGEDKEAVDGIEIIGEQTGNRIQFEARRPGASDYFVGIGSFTSTSAKFVATVPANTSVIVRSGDGSITAKHITGRLELRTEDGSIRTIETSGDLLAETGDGRIELEGVAGRVEARTEDGSVRVTGTPSMLRVRSGDGSVVLRIRSGAVMDGDWMVVTEDGSVEVELPDGFDCEIETDPRDGRTRNELDLSNVTGGTRDRPSLTGRLGEGGYLLTIRTDDGNIRLIKY
jgi:hypothetical protein